MKYIMIVIMVAFGCKTKHPSAAIADFVPDFTKGPPTMVFTTKNNYSKLVPVLLSEDKGRIVVYPGKGDILYKEEFPLPTALHDGYYLDNRGINKNVAFLKLTYEEYSRLDSIPSVKEMYEWILDKDPLTSLCDCGSRNAFRDVKGQLNELIKTGKLRSICHVVK